MKTRYRTVFAVFSLCLFSVVSLAQELDENASTGPERAEAADPRDRFTTTPQQARPGFDGDAPGDELIQSGDRLRELDWPPPQRWRNDP
jgi:hypothetical protein